MNNKILVVDDDKMIRNLLCDILRNQKYEVFEAEDGMEAIRIFVEEKDFNLVLLDVMMPEMDGWQVLKEIRAISNVPVIMLTALENDDYEIKGLNNGANDYITKPFSYEVLLARIKAALRSSGFNQDEMIIAGKIEINEIEHKVYVEGEEVILNNKEYQLLTYLIKNQKIAMDRDRILVAVWGYDYEGTARTVDTHIKMIRSKLGVAGHYIRTIRGTGYCFEVHEKKKGEF